MNIYLLPFGNVGLEQTMAKILLDVKNLLGYYKGGETDFAESELEESLEEYIGERKNYLCKTELIIDNIDYDNVYQPLDFFSEIDYARTRFIEPNTKKKWDYNRPTIELLLKPDGSGNSLSFPYNPERFDNFQNPENLVREKVMYSIFITRGYEPRTIKEASETVRSPNALLVSRHHTITTFWDTVRSGKVIPFEIRICIYTRETRRIYDIDLLRNRLISDFRNGKVASKNVVKPPALVCMYFDRIWAALDIPQLNKKVFTLLFHSEGVTPAEVGHVLGIPLSMAKNHLKSLEHRNLAKVSGKTSELYKPNLSEYKRIAEEITFS